MAYTWLETGKLYPSQEKNKKVSSINRAQESAENANECGYFYIIGDYMPS